MTSQSNMFAMTTTWRTWQIHMRCWWIDCDENWTWISDKEMFNFSAFKQWQDAKLNKNGKLCEFELIRELFTVQWMCHVRCWPRRSTLDVLSDDDNLESFEVAGDGFEGPESLVDLRLNARPNELWIKYVYTWITMLHRYIVHLSHLDCMLQLHVHSLNTFQIRVPARYKTASIAYNQI